MVNNSPNINKMNNDLSPQLTEHKKKTMKYDVGKYRIETGTNMWHG